jgi:hypothetical protein
MTTLRATSPLDELRHLVASPPDDSTEGRWRWSVRARMAGVRDLLAQGAWLPEDGALAPRHVATLRERDGLLARLADLGPRVLESADLAAVRADLVRLLADVRHHLQRRSDLAWDDVQLDIGGSE